MPRIMLRRRRRTLLGLTPLACAVSAALTAVALFFVVMLGVGLRAAKTLRAPLTQPLVPLPMRTRPHSAHAGVGNRSESAVVASAEEDEEDDELPEKLVVITVRAERAYRPHASHALGANRARRAR
jgi:hypothetical protein